MAYYTTQEARARLGHLISEAVAGDPPCITYHGVPAVYVVDAGEWQLLQSKIGRVRSADSGSASDSHLAREREPRGPGSWNTA